MRRLIAPTVVAVTLAAPAVADTLDVPAEYPSIKSAITAAIAGDEVVVAPGVYYELLDFDGKAITVRSSGGPEVTTIDGAWGGQSVVTFETGEGRDSVLEGFTIAHGYALAGGGIVCRFGASPTVRDCVLRENSANIGGGMWIGDGAPLVEDCRFEQNGASPYNGGGMYCGGATPTIRRCTFVANIAPGGGGIDNVGSAPTIEECHFEAHTGGFGGSAISNQSSSDAVIRDCTFEGNEATFGGAIRNHDSAPEITGCTFTNNSALTQGGAIDSSHSAPMIVDCVFDANTARFGSGATNSYASTATFRGCRFTGNAVTVSGHGGAIHALEGTPEITNCFFDGNTTVHLGGAVYLLQSVDAAVTNATFVNNAASGGGAIHVAALTATVANTIAWGNAPNEIGLDPSSTLDVHHCLVEGGWAGDGNMAVDPLFVDAAGGDYRLGAGSPAIDAGANGAVPEGVTLDLDGAPRFVDDPDVPDTGKGTVPIVDLGAHEHQVAATCPADVDGDGAIDFGDLLDVLANWGPCAGCPADVDGDGAVGFADLLEVLATWGPC